MQYIFIQATKQHLFSARLSRRSQPNMIRSHALSLSHVSQALRYEPGSTSTRTKQPVPLTTQRLPSDADPEGERERKKIHRQGCLLPPPGLLNEMWSLQHSYLVGFHMQSHFLPNPGTALENSICEPGADE